MRPLEILGPELYPAEGITPPPRLYYPGSVYEDEIDAMASVIPSLQEDMADGTRRGYDQWYFMGPMQEFFRSQWGQKARGDREFRRAMGLSSASSNSTPVPSEIRKGSLLFRNFHQGLMPAIETYEDAVERVRRARAEGLIPPGYGGYAQGQDFYQAGRFLDGRLGFPVELHADARYKLGDYYNPKIGDIDTGAMDTHIHRWLGTPFVSRSYAATRAAMKEAAGDLPLGRAQPAVWMVRGGRTPGFDSIAQPSLMHWYEAAAKKMAEITGEDPLTVLKKFVRGKGLLAGLMAPMAISDEEALDALDQGPVVRGR